jgi:hypothetical protein
LEAPVCCGRTLHWCWCLASPQWRLYAVAGVGVGGAAAHTEHRFGLLDISTVSIRTCDAGTIMTHAALTSVARARDSTVLWLCRAVSGATMTAVMPACPRAWWEGRCGLHMAGGGVSVWVWAGCLCVFV